MQERLLRMNYVPFDSNRTLVRIRTGFFVLFSVFKKRMTLGEDLKFPTRWCPLAHDSYEWGD